MADDFKNLHTIAELRSDRTDDPRDWSPRDLLVTVLRKIDTGEIDPDTCCVILADPEPDKPANMSDTSITFWTAGPSKMRTLAIADIGLAMHRDSLVMEMKERK